MGKPVSGPAAAPTPDEFKVRPHVRQLLLRYERRPTINPDAQRDLTAWARLTLALDPLEVAVLFGLVSAVDGGPEFDAQQDGPVALLLRELLNYRPALERLAQAPLPQARLAGRKPNLARRWLVLGLALEWESMGLIPGTSKNAASIGHGEDVSGPFVRACVAVTEHLEAPWALTARDVVNELDALRQGGLLRPR